MEGEEDCSWSRSRWEGVGFEIQHTLGPRREEEEAGPLRLVDFGFYFKWMGILLVHFWLGDDTIQRKFLQRSAWLGIKECGGGTLRREWGGRGAN